MTTETPLEKNPLYTRNKNGSVIRLPYSHGK